MAEGSDDGEEDDDEDEEDGYEEEYGDEEEDGDGLEDDEAGDSTPENPHARWAAIEEWLAQGKTDLKCESQQEKLRRRSTIEQWLNEAEDEVY